MNGVGELWADVCLEGSMNGAENGCTDGQREA